MARYRGVGGGVWTLLDDLPSTVRMHVIVRLGAARAPPERHARAAGARAPLGRRSRVAHEVDALNGTGARDFGRAIACMRGKKSQVRITIMRIAVRNDASRVAEAAGLRAKPDAGGSVPLMPTSPSTSAPANHDHNPHMPRPHRLEDDPHAHNMTITQARGHELSDGCTMEVEHRRAPPHTSGAWRRPCRF